MGENTEIRDVKDALDSLHRRMDRFYSWASQLQVEMRNVNQRLWILETALGKGLVSNVKIVSNVKLVSDVKPNRPEGPEPTEASILERLERFKAGPEGSDPPQPRQIPPGWPGCSP